MQIVKQKHYYVWQTLYIRQHTKTILHMQNTSGPEVITLFSCSTQLSTKFIMHKCKISTILGILTFISMKFILINSTSEKHTARNILFVGIVDFVSSWNFMLSWVEHEKSFITLGPGLHKNACFCILSIIFPQKTYKPTHQIWARDKQKFWTISGTAMSFYFLFMTCMPS